MIVSRALEAAPAAEPGTAADLGTWPAELAIAAGTGRPLPGAPWSLRLARGAGGRPALEVYENGTLLDVMVATPVAAEVLRGARRAGRDRRHRALAWGHLLSDGASVTVTFRRRHVRTASSAAAVTEIGTSFWVAVTDGYFNRVSVGYGSGAMASPGIRR